MSNDGTATDILDIADLAYGLVCNISDGEGDLSRSAPIMKRFSQESGYVARIVVEAFKQMELQHGDELMGMGYKSFVNWDSNNVPYDHRQRRR